MRSGYIAYTIYECPSNPLEHGKYIGMVQLREQAEKACELAKERGKSYFIKALKWNGEEVLLL